MCLRTVGAGRARPLLLRVTRGWTLVVKTSWSSGWLVLYESRLNSGGRLPVSGLLAPLWSPIYILSWPDSSLSNVMGEWEKLLVKLFKDFRQVRAYESFYNYYDRRNLASAPIVFRRCFPLPLMLCAFPVLLFMSSKWERGLSRPG